MSLVKLLLLNFILLFGLFSCNSQDSKDNSKIISTVSVLENKVEKLEKKVDRITDKESVSKKIDKKNDFCDKFIKSGKYYKVWGKTEPSINETHIFCGEYNKRGKPTGFHSKIFGEKPNTIVSLKIKDKANKYGVYTAKIEVKDLKGGTNKTKFSSIFPDNLSMEEVEKAIVNAFKNNYKYNKSSGFFKGPSGLGFDISGYTYKNTGKIATAFPIYTK